MIEVQNASFAYDGKPVFMNVSFTLRRGEVLSILGPNGCGKSTLLSCLAGFLTLDQGEIRIDGGDLRALSATQSAKKIGFMPQAHAPVFSYTVFEFVLMGRAPYLRLFDQPSEKDEQIARQAIRQMELDHLADQPYDRLSGGERQQVLFARLIAQMPQIVLLDEPASSLDFGNQHKTLKIIRNLALQGYTVVMATHFPDHAMLVSDRVMLLSEHSISRFGTPRDVLTPENLTALYGIPTLVEYVPGAGRSLCIFGLDSPVSPV